jgi:hypothetical protein
LQRFSDRMIALASHGGTDCRSIDCRHADRFSGNLLLKTKFITIAADAEAGLEHSSSAGRWETFPKVAGTEALV